MSKINDNYIIPFGKHKGQKLIDVPGSYLLWLTEQEWANERHPELYEYCLKNKKALLMEAEEEKQEFYSNKRIA